MSITSGIVLFAVIWFLVLFVVLPLRLKTQDESGHVVPGTPASAPDDPRLRQKVKIVSVIAVVLWAVVAAVILSGLITVDMIDVFGRMSPDG